MNIRFDIFQRLGIIVTEKESYMFMLGLAEGYDCLFDKYKQSQVEYLLDKHQGDDNE